MEAADSGVDCHFLLYPSSLNAPIFGSLARLMHVFRPNACFR